MRAETNDSFYCLFRLSVKRKMFWFYNLKQNAGNLLSEAKFWIISFVNEALF